MAKRSRKRRLPNQAGKGLIGPNGKRLQQEVRKVLVAVPVNDMCSSWFTYDLARLVGFSAASIPNLQMHLYFHGGTYLHAQREELAEAAVAHDATHILWIDADMRFPKESLAGLLAHNGAIIGTNYTRRRPPHMPVAWAEGNFVWTYDDSTGLVPVDHTGFGLLLMETRVLRDIPQPWFQGSEEGEDVIFCRKARVAGYEVMIDQDLSKYVQHTGTMEFNYLHALDAKELMERVAQEEPDGADHKLRIVADGDRELAE